MRWTRAWSWTWVPTVGPSEQAEGFRSSHGPATRTRPHSPHRAAATVSRVDLQSCPCRTVSAVRSRTLTGNATCRPVSTAHCAGTTSSVNRIRSPLAPHTRLAAHHGLHPEQEQAVAGCRLARRRRLLPNCGGLGGHPCSVARARDDPRATNSGATATIRDPQPGTTATSCSAWPAPKAYRLTHQGAEPASGRSSTASCAPPSFGWLHRHHRS
jgi:hypothetical protein